MRSKGLIKVLIVDDSLVFCRMAAEGLETDNRIRVVGFAGDPFEARDRILELEPDVLILDIELPRMDGLTFLRKLMPQYPIPVVVASAHEDMILQALEAGAVDFAKKPVGGGPEKRNVFLQELVAKVKIASRANVSSYKSDYVPGLSVLGSAPGHNKIIAVGASTGGTEAFYTILKELPRHMPGMVVVQHMPKTFTGMYAERLNESCRMEVKEAEDGDSVLAGRVLLAPGGCQMKLVREGNAYKVRCFQGEKVNGHRPSVDVLFESVAREAGKNAIGVLLTGMGSDGAKGLVEMSRRGAYTIGQDEDSCIVYGMPKVAYDMGGVCEQLPLDQIAHRLFTLI